MDVISPLQTPQIPPNEDLFSGVYQADVELR